MQRHRHTDDIQRVICLGQVYEQPTHRQPKVGHSSANLYGVTRRL